MQRTSSEKKNASILTPSNIGSILAFAIISGLGLAWLFIYVIIPIFATFQYTLQYELSFFFDMLTAFLILFAVLYNGLSMSSQLARNRDVNRSVEGEEKSGAVQTPSVKRFSLNQRIQHIWLIVTVGICALTGFDQFYFDSWGRPVVLFLGGLPENMNLHLLAAFFLGILVVYHFTYYAVSYVGKRLARQPVHLEMIPSRREVSDFFADLKFMLGSGSRPKFAKYSYAQKFDYWSVYWGIAILGVPGMIMWAYGYSTLGGLPFIFHTKEAILAIFWIWMFHFYHTHLNPTKFPVNWTFLTGRLTEKEMLEEHPLELDRIRAESD
ncbi:MAG: hypothetical protein ABSE82_03640 [Nitrososphaerales archaeon]